METFGGYGERTDSPFSLSEISTTEGVFFFTKHYYIALYSVICHFGIIESKHAYWA